jgi:hypothetical protein
LLGDRFFYGRFFHGGFGFLDGLRFGLDYGFGFLDRFRLLDGLRFGLDYGFGFRLGHGLDYGFRFGFLDGLRFGSRHGFGVAGEVVALDHGNALGLKLVLFLLLFLAGLVQDFGEFHVHLFGRLFQFQVFAELFVQVRQELVRDFEIRIGVLDAGTLGIEEFHEGVQPDIELFDKFRKSDFCHI